MPSRKNKVEVKSPSEVIIIGIDPGVNGGIAVISGNNVSIVKMPSTTKDIIDLFEPYRGKAVAFMEKLHGMPGMSGTGMHKLGFNCGALEAILLMHQIQLNYVIPQKWQKTYGVGTKSACASATEWKNKLKAVAQQLFPKQKIFLWGSDALLIAEYGRKIYK